MLLFDSSSFPGKNAHCFPFRSSVVYSEVVLFIESQDKKVLPIASGKGGVGKSFVTANLGVVLASLGKRTIVVDLDLGGSNLHTYLGIKNRNLGIGHFLHNKNIDFRKLVVDTPYENLQFVAGDVLVAGLGNILQSQRKSLISRIQKLEAEYILLDLGSGTSLNVLDFFLISNAGLVVTTPQPPSILNAYSLLKNSLFRLLQTEYSKAKRVSQYLKEVVKDRSPGSTPTISQILTAVDAISSKTGKEARRLLSTYRPHLVVNMAGSPEDVDIAESLRDLVWKNLEIDLGCLGMVFRDAAVDDAMQSLEPVTVADPDALASFQIERIAQKIFQSPEFPLMPLDVEDYGDSYGLARIEAEDDYAEIEDQMAARETGVSEKDFMTIIAAQKREIEELKGTVRMLTINQR